MPAGPRWILWLARLKRAAFLVTYLPLALLLSGPAVFRAGWPQSHEQLAPFERVECFRRALASGVWLPTWSPYPFAGYGSPFPLLYHRLFNLVAGWAAFAVGSSVIAVKALVPVLLVLGGLGMYRLCRELDVSRSLSWASGVLLMAAPYTLVDWLVRGAVAEFTAAMLFPWWLSMLVGFLRGVRRWLTLSILTAALFHAHSVMCLFALPFAVAAFALAFAQRTLTIRDLKLDWRHIAAGALILCVSVPPFVLAIARVMPSVNTEAFKSFTSPAQEFKAFGRYFVDEEFGWGAGFRGVSVELNRYLVVAALAFAFGAACLDLRLRRSATLFLLGALFGCLFLQLPISNWFYVHVPGAFYLQFPWRLNAFMTPILIGLVSVSGQSCAAASKRSWRAVHVVMLACLLFSLEFPLRALRLDYARYSAEELAANVASVSDDVAGLEYLPSGVGVPTRPPNRRGRARAAVAPPPVTPTTPLVSSDCDLAWPEEFTGKTLTLDVTSARECQVHIRQFPSPVLGLELDNATVLTGPPSDGLQIALHAGTSHVRLRQKSVAELAAEFLTKRR